MLKVFVDSDVVLDLLSGREPHVDAATRIFAAFEDRRARGLVSALSFANLHYVLCRLGSSSKEAVRALERLRALVMVLPLDEKAVARALASEHRDFEDALQRYCAEAGGADCLVTRNLRDFKGAGIEVLSPSDLLKKIGEPS